MKPIYALFLDYAVPLVFNREQVDVIYFDMTKAFDKVNHSTLLTKLDSYCLCLTYCQWFKSYLTCRTNYVRVSGSMSDYFSSPSGVPQGSNLGPLLFLMFVNDISLCAKNSKVLLYADDIKLFRRVQSHSDCVLLQEDALQISQWCAKNYLPPNEQKIRTMSLTRKRDSLAFSYTIGGSVITRVSVIRDLGIFIDSSLNFNHHVLTICNASFRNLGAISRFTRKFSSPVCLVRLFCCLVRTKLEYASSVWNCINLTASWCIERVQKRIIGIIYDRYFDRTCYYSYEQLLEKLGLCTLLDRGRLRDLMFLHKVVNGAVDSPLLLSTVCFHAPLRSNRFQSPFYPSALNVASPLTRMQLEFNKLDQSAVDIFSDLIVFRHRLESIICT